MGGSFVFKIEIKMIFIFALSLCHITSPSLRHIVNQAQVLCGEN